MFCRKCGKPVPDGQEYCDECRKLDIVAGETDDEAKPAMKGFVPALIAAIIGAGLAAFVPVIAWLTNGRLNIPWFAEIIIALAFGGATTPSVILGIKSVKLFVRCARDGKTRPVVTLVLGIVALAACLSVITACFGFIKDVIALLIA